MNFENKHQDEKTRAVAQKVAQRKANNTGLPDNLKSGIENLSGHSMDDVKVHYNSPRPAQLQAHAFAQGNQIHLSSGQEKHLPHEAWHVAQQKQGRVQPTMQLKYSVSVNDDPNLEKEADVMGNKSLIQGNRASKVASLKKTVNDIPVLQPRWLYEVHGSLHGDVVINHFEKLVNALKAHLTTPIDDRIFSDHYIIITSKPHGAYDLMIDGHLFHQPSKNALIHSINQFIVHYNATRNVGMKQHFAQQVRIAHEITQDAHIGSFAIGGSLAMQMWQLALNPNTTLHRPAGDLDILIRHNEAEEQNPIVSKIVEHNERGLPKPLMEPKIKSKTHAMFSGHNRQMIEENYKQHGVDLKGVTKNGRWNKIHSVAMKVIDGAHSFHLPLQTPQALLAGLRLKADAVRDQPEELRKVKKDIHVVEKLIIDLEAYQEAHH